MLLRGSRIQIRRVRVLDAEAYFDWFADPGVTEFLPLAGKAHLPMESIRAHLTAVSSSERPEFGVTIETSEGRLIGGAGFRNFAENRAEVSIVIGERAQWGRGLGAESVRLLLELGFSSFGLDGVWLVVREENARATRLFRRLGFRTEAVLENAVIVDGLPRTKLRMGLSRETWLNRGLSEADVGPLIAAESAKW